jgi:hypothetical protein
MAITLLVVCGVRAGLVSRAPPATSGDPRLWTRKALGSKRVFLSLILGCARAAVHRVPGRLYLVAGKFGAWAPADVPYDEMLNTVLPWAAVLFAGFFPR